MWNSLEKGDIIVATYNYFQGMSIYRALKNEDLGFVQNRLYYCNQMAVEDLNGYISEHCWKSIATESASSDVDHSNFADIFSCIILLSNDQNVDRLMDEFYARQTENISSCLQSSFSLSLLLGRLLNIIMNTVKCSRVFFPDSNYESLLAQRYRKVINATYTSHLHKQTSILINGNVPFKIATEVNFDLTKLAFPLSNDKIQSCIRSARTKVDFILEKKVKHISTINDIYSEIRTTEDRLLKDHKFSEWEEYVEIVDVNAYIWQGCIKAAFEKRVYEISQEKIDSIVNQVEALLYSSQSTIEHSDTDMVEFVWIDSMTTNRNSQFHTVINNSCDIVGREFKALLADISPLREHYPNYLTIIYKQVFDFLSALQDRITRLQDTKQFILFGAVFFDKMLQANQSFRGIFELQGNAVSGETSWFSFESKMETISDSYFCHWFEFTVTSHFANFKPELFVDMGQFVHNLACWEKVPISENQQLAEPSENSAIEAPMQISLSLESIIDNICVDINKYGGYTLSRTVLLYILGLIGQNAVSVYTTAISRLQSSEYPQTAKQMISIQLYFDLFFLKSLFLAAKDESLRSNQLAQVNQLLTVLESTIDPFDLHIVFPNIQNNAEKLYRLRSTIFGFLFADKSTPGSSRTEKTTGPDGTKEVRHNIMLAHSSNCTFGYL